MSVDGLARWNLLPDSWGQTSCVIVGGRTFTKIELERYFRTNLPAPPSRVSGWTARTRPLAPVTHGVDGAIQVTFANGYRAVAGAGPRPR